MANPVKTKISLCCPRHMANPVKTKISQNVIQGNYFGDKIISMNMENVKQKKNQSDYYGRPLNTT